MIWRGPLAARLLIAQPVNGPGIRVELEEEVLSVDVFVRLVRRDLSFPAGQEQARDGAMRLVVQRRGQRCDSVEEVLALLLPAELGHCVVLGVQHRSRM